MFFVFLTRWFVNHQINWNKPLNSPRYDGISLYQLLFWIGINLTMIIVLARGYPILKCTLLLKCTSTTALTTKDPGRLKSWIPQRWCNSSSRDDCWSRLLSYNTSRVTLFIHVVWFELTLLHKVLFTRFNLFTKFA